MPGWMNLVGQGTPPGAIGSSRSGETKGNSGLVNALAAGQIISLQFA